MAKVVFAAQLRPNIFRSVLVRCSRASDCKTSGFLAVDTARRSGIGIGLVIACINLHPQMLSQSKSDFMFGNNKDEAGKLRKEMEEKEARYCEIHRLGSYEICEMDWFKKDAERKRRMYIISRGLMRIPNHYCYSLPV